MTVELHRPLAIDRIPSTGATVEVEAGPAEREALARRMGVPAIASLRCRFDLVPVPGRQVVAEGHLRARVTRTCVVTLDEFEADTDERFRLRFVPVGSESEDEDPESDDEVAYEGGSLDLGEAAAEQLALALDPWPRKTGAELPSEASEAAESPFAALARPRRPS